MRVVQIRNISLMCYTPLTLIMTHYSTRNCRNLYILQLAIAYNADIEKRYHHTNLIARAISCNNLLSLNVLIAHNVNVNVDNGDPLCSAIRLDNCTAVDFIKALILAGVDVNMTPHGCRTAFEVAIEYCSVGIVSMLIDAGVILPYSALVMAHEARVDRRAKINLIQQIVSRGGHFYRYK